MASLRISKVYRVFITCMSADCLVGLPGLLRAVSASRTLGNESTNIPVHLYGPPGLTAYVNAVMQVRASARQPLPCASPRPHGAPVPHVRRLRRRTVRSRR